MEKKSRIGSRSFLVALFGTIILFICTHLGYLKHQAWYIVLAGFEAALIGAVADWFAVSALFREIPIPLVRRHTNIIAKSRARLSEGITDLVANEWLSQESIHTKLQSISFVDRIVLSLKKGRSQEQIQAITSSILTLMLNQGKMSDLSVKVRELIQQQLSQVDMAHCLGTKIEELLDKKKHYPLWSKSLRVLLQRIDTPDVRKLVENSVSNEIQGIVDKGGIKSLLFSAAQSFGGIDDEQLASKIINALKQILGEAERDPNHPLRMELEDELYSWAKKSKEKDPKVYSQILSWQRQLSDELFSDKVVSQWIAQYTKGDKQSALIHSISTQIGQYLSANPKTATQIDSWIKEQIEHLVAKKHHYLAKTIKNNIDELTDKELIDQIQGRVGNDLEYIRLNGAIVGGLVGLVLALFKAWI